jgi:GNAT superfamily N-acetyltransferase
MITTMGEYSITTDNSKMDIPVIHSYLTRSYWAEGIPVETVARAIEGSMCFGLFHGSKQIGVARVISDKATFAYLCDVFILPAHRGVGLSKWLMQTIMSHPDLQGLRRWSLATLDAHGLYKQFGFTIINNPDSWMQIFTPYIAD